VSIEPGVAKKFCVCGSVASRSAPCAVTVGDAVASTVAGFGAHRHSNTVSDSVERNLAHVDNSADLGYQNRSGTVGDAVNRTVAVDHITASDTVSSAHCPFARATSMASVGGDMSSNGNDTITGGTANSTVAGPDAHRCSNTASDLADDNLAFADSGSQVRAVGERKEPTGLNTGPNGDSTVKRSPDLSLKSLNHSTSCRGRTFTNEHFAIWIGAGVRNSRRHSWQSTLPSPGLETVITQQHTSSRIHSLHQTASTTLVSFERASQHHASKRCSHGSLMRQHQPVERIANGVPLFARVTPRAFRRMPAWTDFKQRVHSDAAACGLIKQCTSARHHSALQPREVMQTPRDLHQRRVQHHPNDLPRNDCLVL
jgi:hypothetical protein